MHNNALFDDIKTLCTLRGVSGDEEEVRSYILARVKKAIGGSNVAASDSASASANSTSNAVTDDGESGTALDTAIGSVRVDSIGNIIVSKKGKKAPQKKVMLCAHMDEVGVICTSITDDGYLRFAMSGGIDRRVVVGKTVEFGKNRVLGIIGCKPMHFSKGKDAEKVVETEDMYIDIGAKNRFDAEKLIEIGDTGSFDATVAEFGDGFIKAKAIDDRFGCAVLLGLIESDLPIDCTFSFNVQEEVGLRGAYTAAYSAAPDIALVVEATTAADLPSVPDGKKVCKPGSGAVIPFMDGGTIYDKGLFKLLTRLADSNGIPWQTKNVVAGGTDGAAFQRSRAGVKTVGLAIPVRNLHSPSCVAKRSDMDAVAVLARLFLEEMGEQR